MRYRPRHPYPLSLSDTQMQMIMLAAQPLNPDQRHSLLLRIEAGLKRTRITMPSDALLARCVQAALDEVMTG